MVKIYTPGHGHYTDTLIAYGVSAALLEYNIGFNIEGVERIYIIDADAELEEIALAISKYTLSIKDNAIVQLIDNLRLIQKQTRRKLMLALDKLANVDECAKYLKSLQTPGHAERLGEGRGAKGVILWLPLSPFAGKFFTGSFKYGALAYKVCLSCAGLASLGLLSMFMPIRLRGRVYVTTLAFTGMVDDETLSVLKDYLGEERFLDQYKIISGAAENMPLRVLPFTILSILSGYAISKLDEAEASWKAYTITFDVRRATQIRGFSELNIDNILSSLNILAKHTALDQLSTLVVGIAKGLRRGIIDPYILKSLMKYLGTRNIYDLYEFSRIAKISFEGELGKITGRRGLGIDLCRKLALLAI